MYRVGGRYFVDLGAMFGSRNAGDSWNLTMEFIVQAMKQHTRVDNVDYYVDNAVYHYPPSEGQDNTRLANEEFKRIIEFLRVANVPYHEVVEPTTIGWLRRRSNRQQARTGGQCFQKTLQTLHGVHQRIDYKMERIVRV